jgi:hypothetical protein
MRKFKVGDYVRILSLWPYDRGVITADSGNTYTVRMNTGWFAVRTENRLELETPLETLARAGDACKSMSGR